MMLVEKNDKNVNEAMLGLGTSGKIPSFLDDLKNQNFINKKAFTMDFALN